MLITKRSLSRMLSEIFKKIVCNKENDVGYLRDIHGNKDIIDEFLSEWVDSVNEKNNVWYVNCEYDHDNNYISCHFNIYDEDITMETDMYDSDNEKAICIINKIR
jgi:hypothetical protein